jgi:hypothetical protein
MPVKHESWNNSGTVTLKESILAGTAAQWYTGTYGAQQKQLAFME